MMKKFLAISIFVVVTGSLSAMAQEFALPASIEATPQQIKQIKAYYDKAPLLEKFFILTGLNFDHSWLNSYTDSQLDIIAQRVILEINGVKEYKTKKHEEKSSDDYYGDLIDSKSGYIRINGRAMTYWKYGDGRYIIATNVCKDLGCCGGFGATDPEFFTYDGNLFTLVDQSTVLRSQDGNNWWRVEWFDLFTPEEYIEKYVTQSEGGEGFPGISMYLPSKGFDIIIAVAATGCGGDRVSTGYEARYKWNGDGTFTKVGRSDDFIKQVAEKIKREQEAVK